MSKTYATMKTNVGNFVIDTSNAFATLIGNFINDKYRDISRRSKWSALIDDNYTFPTVAGTAEYTLPTKFDRELFVADITNGVELKRENEGNWWKDNTQRYSGGTTQRGMVFSYVILTESSKIKLSPTPNAIVTIAFPYQLQIAELSGNTDTVVIPDIEYALELGAIAEALAYKKQYQKADYYFQRYELEVGKRIGQEKSQFNQIHQRISSSYQIPRVGRLTGDISYDTV